MKKLFPVCLIFIFIGCERQGEVPKGVITKEKMSRVMWDIIQADQFLSEFISGDSVKKRQQRYTLYEKVYKVNSINREIFNKSFKYYSTHPDQLKIILDSITARTSREAPTIYRPAITIDSLSAK